MPGATTQMWSFESNKATLADAASATEMALRPTRSIILYNRHKLIENTPQACTWFAFDDNNSRHVLPVGTPLVVDVDSLANVSHMLTYGGAPVYTLDATRLGVPDVQVPWARWVNPPARKKYKGVISTALHASPSKPKLKGFMLGIKSGMRSKRTTDIRHVHTVVSGRTFITTEELEDGGDEIKTGTIIEKWGRRMRVLVRNDNLTLVNLSPAPLEFDAHFDARPLLHLVHI